MVVKAIVDYGVPGWVREIEIEVEDWCSNQMIDSIIEAEITNAIVYEWHKEEE